VKREFHKPGFDSFSGPAVKISPGGSADPAILTFHVSNPHRTKMR